MVLSILVGVLVYTYRMHRHREQPHRVLWRESVVSDTTRRAQYSINSATDAPALLITPFVTSSNNASNVAPFGRPSGGHGWEEGMPRPRQPSTRYPEWQRPIRPLPPTFRTEVHVQAPNFPPNRNPPQATQTRYTHAPSLFAHAHNSTLSPPPHTFGTAGISDPPLSAVSATSTTPLTQGGPATPISNWGYRSPRRLEPVVVASPAPRSSSLHRSVSTGIKDTSQRPFSEVSITIPYLIEPLSPDPRSPALVAASPIDAAYPIQPSAFSILQIEKRPRTPPEDDTHLPRSSGLQPPGPVVEPPSSLGTRRPSRPTLTPPSSAGLLQPGSSPTTPNSRIRVVDARERQEGGRLEREEVKRQEQMRSVTTGMPAIFRQTKGLEARDARLKATDNMRDILDALDEQRIGAVNHKGSWGKKMGLKRPKGMSIDTRMGGGSFRGKKSPLLSAVSTPKTSASSRPPPTAGIPVDIEPGSPERVLSSTGDHEMRVITQASIAKSRKVDRKGTDEDRIASWPLDALQTRTPGFRSGNSSPLTSPEEKVASTVGRPSPMSAQSRTLREHSRVDIPSSSPVDNFNSPVSPNLPSAGLATPSWLQSTFMSTPQTPPSAGTPSPTPEVQTSKPVSVRPLNVGPRSVPQEPPGTATTLGSASFAPIMEAQDPRFSIVDPSQTAGSDRRRGGVDASRTNTPLSHAPSTPRKTPTPVQTSARTVHAGESGWF